MFHGLPNSYEESSGIEQLGLVLHTPSLVSGKGSVEYNIYVIKK